MTGQELWYELLFGSGSWLALILILGFILLVYSQIKMSAFIFVPILIFLGIVYYNEFETSSFSMWNFVICFLASIILLMHALVTFRD